MPLGQMHGCRMSPWESPVTGTACTGTPSARSGTTLKRVHDIYQCMYEHALVPTLRRRTECAPGADRPFASFHYIQRIDEIHDQTDKQSVSKTDICAAVGTNLTDIKLAHQFQRNQACFPGKRVFPAPGRHDACTVSVFFGPRPDHYLATLRTGTSGPPCTCVPVLAWPHPRARC